MKKKPTAEEVNEQIIAGWKNEHEKVVRFSTSDGKVGYFKNPDLQACDAASAMAATNPVKSNQLLAKACFLGGDEELTTEAKYLTSKALGQLLRALMVTVEGEHTEL